MQNSLHLKEHNQSSTRYINFHNRINNTILIACEDESDTIKIVIDADQAKDIYYWLQIWIEDNADNVS